MMTLFGMALGGWMSGAVFDYFGSYQAAFPQRPRLESPQSRHCVRADDPQPAAAPGPRLIGREGVAYSGKLVESITKQQFL